MASYEDNNQFILNMDVSGLTSAAQEGAKSLDLLSNSALKYAKVVDQVNKKDGDVEAVIRTVTAMTENHQKINLKIIEGVNKKGQTVTKVKETITTNLEAEAKALKALQDQHDRSTKSIIDDYEEQQEALNKFLSESQRDAEKKKDDKLKWEQIEADETRKIRLLLDANTKKINDDGSRYIQKMHDEKLKWEQIEADETRKIRLLLDANTKKINDDGSRYIKKMHDEKLKWEQIEADETRKIRNRLAEDDKKKREERVKNTIQGMRDKNADSTNDIMRDRLGGIPILASQGGIIGIKQIENQINSLVRTGKVSKGEMLKLFDAIRAGTTSSLPPLSANAKKAEIAILQLTKAFHTAATAGKRTQDILISWQGLIRIFIVQQLHQIIGKTTNALIQSGQQAAEYAKEIGLIQTISQDANVSTEQWSASLAKLSSNFGVDLLDTTKGAYQALSNQIARGAEVTSFMAESLIFARTTGATAEQSVNLLSSVINAYGLSAASAERISASLFKTIDLGRVSATEMSNSIGNTAIIADQLGLKFEELEAGITTLTRQGIKYDVASTLLNNVMLKLLKPTTEMKELLVEWGVESGEAAVKTFGFVGVMRRLNAEFAKNGLSRLAEVGSEMRNIRGLAGVAGDAFKDYDKDLTALLNTTGEYNKASELTANTLQHRLAVELTKLQNYFTSDAGQRYLDITVKLVEGMGGLAKNIKPVADGFLNLYEIGSKFLVTTNGIVTSSTSMFGGLSKLIPTLVGMGTAYLAANFAINKMAVSQRFWNAELSRNLLLANQVHWIDQMKVKLLGMQLAIDGTTASLRAMAVAFLTSPIGLITIAVSAATYAYTSYLEQQRKITDAAKDTQARLQELSQEGIRRRNAFLDQETQQLKTKLDEREQAILQAMAKIKRGLNLGKVKFDELGFKFDSQDFENSLLGKTTLERADLLRDRIFELVNLGSRLDWSDMGEKAQKVFEDVAEKVRELNKEISKGQEDAQKDIDKLLERKDSNRLETLLFGKSKGAQFNILKQEIDKLIGQGKLEQALKQAEKLGNLAENKGRRSEADKIESTIIDQLINQKRDEQEQLNQRLINERDIAEEKLRIVERQKKAYQETVDIVQQLANALKAVRDAQDASTKKISESESKIRGDGGDLVGRAKQIFEFMDSLGIRRSNIELQSLAKNVQQFEEALAAQNLDPKRLAELRKELLEIITAIQDPNNFRYTGIGGNQVGNTGQTFDSKMGELRTSLLGFGLTTQELQTATEERLKLAQQQLQIEQASANTAERLTQFGKQFKDLLPELERPINIIDQAIKDMNVNTDKLINNLRTIQGGQNGVPARALGGLMGFAPGGLLRGGKYGRDNRLFMGHDGEFVMNAEATRQFYPQLVAMNSGYSGAMNNGGPITNVGDININATLSGNVDYDVNRLGQQLRRNIKRGVTKL